MAKSLVEDPSYNVKLAKTLCWKGQQQQQQQQQQNTLFHPMVITMFIQINIQIHVDGVLAA